MKLEKLKQLTDYFYGFDISERNRSRKVAYARKVFCKLAREMNHTFEKTGGAIGISHCSALYHNNTFDVVQKYDIDIYNKIQLYYNNLENDAINSVNIEIIESSKRKIKRLENKILKLQEAKLSNQADLESIINIVNDWDAKTIEEFVSTRLVPFQRLVKSRVIPKAIEKVEGANILRPTNNVFLR